MSIWIAPLTFAHIVAPRRKLLGTREIQSSGYGALFFYSGAGEELNLHVLADTGTSSRPGYRYSTRAFS